MSAQTATELRRFISSRKISTAITLIASFVVGWAFGYVSLIAFEEAFRLAVNNSNIEIPRNIHLLSEGVGAFFTLIAFLAFETFQFLIYLKERILLEVVGEDEPLPTILERLLPYDPVDKLTVKILIDDLLYLGNYFGSITYLAASRWFAGDNYLALLLCQVQELVDRKATALASHGEALPANPVKWSTQNLDLDMFRIIVWNKCRFHQKQSIALLRTLYFFDVRMHLPLKTFIITRKRFNDLLKNDKLAAADVRNFKEHGQFWVCDRKEPEKDLEWTLVWGEKQYFLRAFALRRPETPHVVTDKKTCLVAKKILDYVRDASVPLDEVFTWDTMYDDRVVRLRLRDRLKNLEAPRYPDYQ